MSGHGDDERRSLEVDRGSRFTDDWDDDWESGPDGVVIVRPENQAPAEGDGSLA